MLIRWAMRSLGLLFEILSRFELIFDMYIFFYSSCTFKSYIAIGKSYPNHLLYYIKTFGPNIYLVDCEISDLRFLFVYTVPWEAYRYKEVILSQTLFIPLWFLFFSDVPFLHKIKVVELLNGVDFCKHCSVTVDPAYLKR